jgi:hypothetical protein
MRRTRPASAGLAKRLIEGVAVLPQFGGAVVDRHAAIGEPAVDVPSSGKPQQLAHLCGCQVAAAIALAQQRLEDDLLETRSQILRRIRS